MRYFFILLLVATGIGAGCADNSVQQEVIAELFTPFAIPKDVEERAVFLENYRTRISVSPEAAILDYSFLPFLLRKNDNDFADATAALVTSLVNDPVKGMLSVSEEWYYSTHLSDPLLLRRVIIHIDRPETIEEEWAFETTRKQIYREIEKETP